MRSQDRPTVAVLGGGIGGLSTAQELAERGFDVSVYEARERFGGKARSIPVPDSGTDDQPSLLGEHGFRFFPGFYRHLTDTMERIPYEGKSKGVVDNLVPTDRTLIASITDREVTQSTKTPRSVREWLEVLQPLGDVSARDTRYFAERLFTFLTSCEVRRLNEYEQMSWWDFINASERSEPYRKHLAQATQALVALRPDRGSARTIGQIYVQLILGQVDPSMETERILNGPTSEVWIDPWTDHLNELGVNLHPETKVKTINCKRKRVTSVTTEETGSQRKVIADYYVAAVPVEGMLNIITEDLKRKAPSFATLDQLETAWMNGIQFYLTEDISIIRGHEVYTDSPWALTSISQQQFWADHTVADRGVGAAQGVLSVIISDWNNPGILYDKPAWDCSREEIKEEVWAQLKAHLNRNGKERLKDEHLVDWFLDPAINEVTEKDEANGKRQMANSEPLLINTVDSLRYRPEAATPIGNLVLAADYVRTNTDLATMESANEAARRATNAIIRRSDVHAQECEIWKLEEPAIFEPFKQQDRVRYQLGLPHPGEAANRIRGVLPSMRTKRRREQHRFISRAQNLAGRLNQLAQE